MENSHNVPFTRDVTEEELGTDHELQQEPDLPQEQSSDPESDPELTLEPELGQQRSQRVRHPPWMFTYHLDSRLFVIRKLL